MFFKDCILAYSLRFSPNDEAPIFSPHISLLLSSLFVAIKRPQRKFTAVSRSDKKELCMELVCFSRGGNKMAREIQKALEIVNECGYM